MSRGGVRLGKGALSELYKILSLSVSLNISYATINLKGRLYLQGNLCTDVLSAISNTTSFTCSSDKAAFRGTSDNRALEEIVPLSSTWSTG